MALRTNYNVITDSQLLMEEQCVINALKCLEDIHERHTKDLEAITLERKKRNI
jgi:hypothetical protein